MLCLLQCRLPLPQGVGGVMACLTLLITCLPELACLTLLIELFYPETFNFPLNHSLWHGVDFLKVGSHDLT